MYVYSYIVGGNFDIADRTFRKLQTTWWLSSSESATDVKELIPEFFFLPEFLANSESKCHNSINIALFGGCPFDIKYAHTLYGALNFTV